MRIDFIEYYQKNFVWILNRWKSGVNITNILCAAVTRADPKSAKICSQAISLFVLLGSELVKTARKMLMNMVYPCNCSWISLGIKGYPRMETTSSGGKGKFSISLRSLQAYFRCPILFYGSLMALFKWHANSKGLWTTCESFY